MGVFAASVCTVRVCAPGAGLLGVVPGQDGADAAALMDVGHLEGKVDDAGLQADPAGEGQGERVTPGVETDPAGTVLQQAFEITAGDAGAAPAAQEVLGRAAPVQIVDQVPVHQPHRPGEMNDGLVQSQPSRTAARRAARR
ncbi:hypothetical protein ABT104_13190 [Streptomyces mobaraensis]|uniref:hypothetical protein n=1 Tax=Streptomyces mobaraensis TaxID=35621 RepID=UPI00331A3EF1